MMTDAMKPLGLSVWQLTSPAPMRTAGGRLFVDVTQPFRSPASRAAITEALGKSDPLIRDALEAVIERDFVPLQTETQGDAPPGPPSGATSPLPTVETDPAVVDKLIELYRAANRTAEREISTKSGAEVFEFVINDIGALRQVLFDPRSHEVFSSAMEASFWLNDHMLEWLSEPNAADTLTQSVPNNITSEMGLALLDVADVVRSHPDVEDFLRTVEHDDFLDGLAGLDGGPEVRDAIEQYLDLYGVRCVGEIDITRPRWNEQPGSLVPLILSNVDNTEPGAAQRLFEQGLTQATAKEQDLLARLADLPEGEQKVVETKWHIDRVRTFIGYREYPKYAMIWRYFTYKKAMLAEAGRMVDAGVLRQVDDIFFLTLQELHEVALSHQADHGLIADRRAAFDSFHNLTPPRVLTSEGECLSGTYRRDDLPEGALAGVAVSSGTVEGRARVITEMANASIEPGDILVTAHTDPSWAPLFVAVSALVTEVGGTMTHGAVVAREYGLPAVVGVEDATRLITDGQRIRVNGSDGWVELLP
jgi:pyruvate,water dikinase